MTTITLWGLFWIFFYVGLFTIGGGLVAITLMQQTIVARGLISTPQFFNMVAISESTPGPIGINMATYIGTKLFGVGGGIITTAGTVLPSLICILLIAMYFGRVQNKPLVRAAFDGLRPATTGMIAVAAAQVFELALLHMDKFKAIQSLSMLFNWPAIAFYALGLYLLFKFKLHPVLLMVMGAIFGIIAL